MSIDLMKRFKNFKIMTTANTQTAILTTQLRDKTTVLAKNDKRFGINAVTYSNVTQAAKKRDTLKEQGIDCFIWGNSPFYIVIR